MPPRPGQLELLTPEEGRRGGIGDRRDTGIEQLGGGASRLRQAPLLDHRHGVAHNPRELTLVDPARPAVEVLMADVSVLQ
jgi:hypothetical protein